MMRRYDLFVHGIPTEFTGEWRHVGAFKSPPSRVADVVREYIAHTGQTQRVAVFTGSLTSSLGRLVYDSQPEVSRCTPNS